MIEVKSGTDPAAAASTVIGKGPGPSSRSVRPSRSCRPGRSPRSSNRASRRLALSTGGISALMKPAPCVTSMGL